MSIKPQQFKQRAYVDTIEVHILSRCGCHNTVISVVATQAGSPAGSKKSRSDQEYFAESDNTKSCLPVRYILRFLSLETYACLDVRHAIG